jgi:hypothetical protein
MADQHYWTDFLGTMSDRFEMDIMRLNQYELRALMHLISIYLEEEE